MKISARNAFDGTIEAITLGAINSEVDVTLPGGLKIVATVANDAIRELNLAAGKPVQAFVKASSVLLLTDSDGARLSARNRLPGTIAALTEGPVSSDVAIALGNGQTVHATITHEASVALGLKVGTPAIAVFKAPSVILGVTG